MAGEPVGPTQSPRAARRHVWQINAYVSDGRLRVEWDYCRRSHHRATIERLMAEFRGRLEDLIEHCLVPEAGGFTPADFPLARLRQGELDALSELIGE
jgi:non-ribosomal peptide synthase protein (TIGR01720 family)